MNEELTNYVNEELEKLYNILMEMPLRVFNIFSDFFGEDRVDIQGYPTLEMFKLEIKEKSIGNLLPISLMEEKMSSNVWNSSYNKSINNLIEANEDGFIREKVIKDLNDERTKSYIGEFLFNSLFILVHFPHVRVTNEHDRFVDINHLWAKIHIDNRGRMIDSFSLNRSEYTLLHFKCGYMHSHVHLIPKNDFSIFQAPCTGIGPINGTIASLRTIFNEDIWNMFCLELSKYVSTESLTGGPYHRLEQMISNDNSVSECKFYTVTSLPYISEELNSTINKLKDFVRYFINTKKLKFNYKNGSYSIGMTYVEYIVTISNEFIKWYNDKFNKGEVNNTFRELEDNHLIEKCIIANGKVYYEKVAGLINEYRQYIGKKVCTFKGRDITVNITDIDNIDNNGSYILDSSLALYILTVILEVLNYRYGRDKANTEDNKFGTKVRYL